MWMSLVSTWNVFLASLRETDSSDAFLKMIQTSVEVLQRNGYDFTVWHNVLSTFRKYALGGISSTTTMLHAENLFQQARILVGELSQRAQAYRRMQSEQKEEILSNFSFSMAPAMTLEGIGEAISKHFPVTWGCGAGMSCSIAMSALQAPFPRPHRKATVCCCNTMRNKFQIPRKKQHLAPGVWRRAEKPLTDHRYDAVVMPLITRKQPLRIYVGGDGAGRLGHLCPLEEPAFQRAFADHARAATRTGAKGSGTSAWVKRVNGPWNLPGRGMWPKKPQRKTQNSLSPSRTGVAAAEALARSSRQLSSLTTIEKLPQQILEQLKQVLPYDRSHFIHGGCQRCAAYPFTSWNAGGC